MLRACLGVEYKRKHDELEGDEVRNASDSAVLEHRFSFLRQHHHRLQSTQRSQTVQENATSVKTETQLHALILSTSTPTMAVTEASRDDHQQHQYQQQQRDDEEELERKVLQRQKRCSNDPTIFSRDTCQTNTVGLLQRDIHTQILEN